jgi:hypothetical protein
MPCQIVYLLTRDEAQRIAINTAKMTDAAVLRAVTAPTFYCRMFASSRSLCCSNRRRFDSSGQSTLSASNVFAPAALNRTMRPFCLCTKRRASATCSSTRRRSSSKLFASERTSPEHQY